MKVIRSLIISDVDNLKSSSLVLNTSDHKHLSYPRSRKRSGIKIGGKKMRISDKIKELLLQRINPLRIKINDP